jgi:hypothetical protein
MADTQKIDSAARDGGRGGTGDLRIKRIAMRGGASAAWMAASVLARALPGTGCAITFIESTKIRTVGVGVGVGEATIPPMISHFAPAVGRARVKSAESVVR